MPSYLAPGVYVEEVSFRPKSIEGVSTSVAGFIGPTRFGPTSGPPELLTSFADFSRIYGGLDSLQFAGIANPQINYMAHAVRAFFDNGGTMLFVARVYESAQSTAVTTDPDYGKASLTIGSSPAQLILRARFPGSSGQMQITFAVRTTANLLVAGPRVGGVRAPLAVNSVQTGDVVFIKYIGTAGGGGATNEGLYDVVDDGSANPPAYRSMQGSTTLRLSDLNPDNFSVHRVTITVSVLKLGRFEDEQTWTDLSPSTDPNSRNSLVSLFTREPSSRERYLTIPFAVEQLSSPGLSGAQLVGALLGTSVLANVSLSLDTDAQLNAMSPRGTRPTPDQLQVVYTLAAPIDATTSQPEALDGNLPAAIYYEGDDSQQDKTGLKAFEDIDEISIVAAPGHSASYDGNGTTERALSIVQSLIVHCQIRMRYRVAVLDSPDNDVVSDVMTYRGQMDSTHAALYYPWITIIDPLDPDGRREINLPPSGYVAGIYARTDALYGVVKAPANEVVLGAINFETLLNKAQQDVLNPLGINCFRFFEGRGYRLWGARTISSDPDWKYVNVRRYFAYLEHSIDKGTQWAVFENNGDALWANVQQTVSDFLFNEWRNGALLGAKPEQAYFVRCDRSTMTQNDLDNGRLICLVGVAVVKPAEFVIFRIGQWTADATA